MEIMLNGIINREKDKDKKTISGFSHPGTLYGGVDIDAAIKQELAEANLVLLLISNYYFSDLECFEYHNYIMQLKAAEKLEVVPILLSPCDISGTAIENYKTLPSEGSDGKKYISQWKEDQELVYMQIEVELRKLITEGLILKKDPDRERLFESALMRFNFIKEIRPYRKYARTPKPVYAVLLQGTAQCAQDLLLHRLIIESKVRNPKIIPIKMNDPTQSFSLDKIWMEIGKHFDTTKKTPQYIGVLIDQVISKETEVIIYFDHIERYHIEQIKVFWKELLEQLSTYREAGKQKPLYFYLIDRSSIKELNGYELCSGSHLSNEDILHLQIAKVSLDDLENWIDDERLVTPNNALLDEIEKYKTEIMPTPEAYVREVIENIRKICKVSSRLPA